MNLKQVLQIILEDVSVDKIKQATAGKVNEKVLLDLEAKMKETRKGKFYNNTAMSIIKFLQTMPEDEHKKYIEDHAGMIYSILNMAKKGNSAFDMNKVLEDSIKTNDAKYWKDLYSSVRHPNVISKEEKDYNTTGLKTAKTRDIGDAFLIFPKNFYYGDAIKDLDVERSAEDIRKISAEIALKDTSNENIDAPTWEPGRDRKSGAQVNHWCVAASNSQYFRTYKDRGAQFVIIILKKKNGAPDWNKRYLFAYYKDGRYEIADKYDTHIEPLGVFSPGGNIIKTIMTLIQSGKKKDPNSKKEQLRQAIEKEKNDVIGLARKKLNDDTYDKYLYTKVEKNNIEQLLKINNNIKTKSEEKETDNKPVKAEAIIDCINSIGITNFKTGKALTEFLLDKGVGYGPKEKWVFKAENNENYKGYLRPIKRTEFELIISTTNDVSIEDGMVKGGIKITGTPAAIVRLTKSFVSEDEKGKVLLQQYANYTGNSISGAVNSTADSFLKTINYRGYSIDDKKYKLKHPAFQQVFNREYINAGGATAQDIINKAKKGKDFKIGNKFLVKNNTIKNRHDIYELKSDGSEGKYIGYLEDPNFKVEEK